MATVIVKSAGDSIRTFGVGYAKKPDGSSVDSQVELLTLKPGSNEIDLAKWEAAKKLPIVQHLVDEEELSVIDAKSLADLSAPRARKLVADTNDKSLLQKWATSEKRPGVVEAIALQLKKFER